jgi:hypothetical protein
MNTLEASEQISRYEGSEFLAFEPNSTPVLYDMSGIVLDVQKETSETIVWPCEACTKNFATKQSLERHKERFPLCKNWQKGEEPVLSESVYNWAKCKITLALVKDSQNDKTCRFCDKEFSSIGNFHKHFESSNVCNRLGMRAIKKAFQE